MTAPTPTPRVDIKGALRRAIDDFPVIHLRPDTTFAHALAEIERLERELAEANMRISDAPRWIPVSEPPADEQRVLGYYPDSDDPQGSAETLTYYAADAPDGPERWDDRCGPTDAPTHWMPWRAPK